MATETTLLGAEHTRIESYDVDIMEKLLIHPGVSGKEKLQLQKYKKRSLDGNRVAVCYKYGKHQEKNQIGRLYPENALGLASMKREIRCALAQQTYFDCDIDSAHPTILAHLCETHGWAHDKIDEFNRSRNDILTHIMTTKSMTRSEAKDETIAVFFGAFRDSHPFFEPLCAQINLIKDNCADKYPDIYAIAKKKVKEGHEWKDPKSSCLAMTLQNKEREILLTMDSFLKTKGRPFETLIHDGGLIRKLPNETEFPSDLMREVEQHISETIKCDIKLSIKPCFHSFKFPTQGSDLINLFLEFNKRHFYLKDCNLVCEEDDTGIIHRWTKNNAQDALGSTWKNDKIAVILCWMSFPGRRTYSRVGFYPGSLTDDSIYNVYRPPIALTAEPTGLKGVHAFQELIAVLLKRSDADVLFLTRWIAHMFQHPEERVTTCVIFTGDMGLGKDMLWNFIGMNLLGDKLFFNSQNHENDIFGTFNNQLEGRLLIKLEEVDGQFMRKNHNKLKAHITSPTQVINIKNLSTYTVEKYSRVVATSNDSVPVVIDQTDRRFNIFHCGDEKRGDFDWFKQTIKAMDDGRRDIYEYLMAVPLDDFNPNKVYKTDYHSLLSEQEQCQQEVFIDACAHDPSYTCKDRLAHELYNDYTIHCEAGGFSKCNVVHFIRKLAGYIAKGRIIKHPRSGGGQRYTIVRPAGIPECV